MWLHCLLPLLYLHLACRCSVYSTLLYLIQHDLNIRGLSCVLSRFSSFPPRYKFFQQPYDQGNGDRCEQRCIHCKLMLVGLNKRSINEQNVLKKLDNAEINSRSKEGPSWKDRKMLYWRVQQHPVPRRKPAARLNWQIAMQWTVRAHLDQINVFSPVLSPV